MMSQGRHFGAQRPFQEGLLGKIGAQRPFQETLLEKIGAKRPFQETSFGKQNPPRRRQ